MTTIHLGKFLSGHVFAFVFLFSRVGTVLMLFPGIGEAYVPARIRMLLALTMSFLLMEPMLPLIPAPPDGLADLTKLIGYEIIVGLFFGTILRLIMSALETVGAVIALQTGLSNAVALNPALAAESPLPSAFLSITGATLLFLTGLDHMLIRSIMATYNVFPPGGVLQPGDMAQSFIQTFNQSFVVGVELAMPFLVIGVLMYAALGMMQRLMPQVQLFLVVLPIQIWGGLVLFAILFGGIMAAWLHYFDTSVTALVGR